jgi:hypothetical protein
MKESYFLTWNEVFVGPSANGQYQVADKAEEISSLKTTCKL